MQVNSYGHFENKNNVYRHNKLNTRRSWGYIKQKGRYLQEALFISLLPFKRYFCVAINLN